jgi:hypothetical protein
MPAHSGRDPANALNQYGKYSLYEQNLRQLLLFWFYAMLIPGAHLSLFGASWPYWPRVDRGRILTHFLGGHLPRQLPNKSTQGVFRVALQPP